MLLDEPVDEAVDEPADEPVAEQRANVADLDVPDTPPVPAGNVWLALGKTRFVLV